MRVLVVKTSALGDIIQTFPVIEYLKSRQEVTKIGWVVEETARSLVEAHPYVDIPLTINSRKIRSSGLFRMIQEYVHQRATLREHTIDVVFDLQGNIKSGFVTAAIKAREKVGYGKNFVAEIPNILATNRRFDPPLGLPIREEYLSIVQQYFEDDAPFKVAGVDLSLTMLQNCSFEQEMARWPSQGPVWLIAVGSAWTNKMCDKDTFKRILTLAQNHFSPYYVFLAGNALELNEVESWSQEFPQKSHVLYRPDLPVLQRCMAKARVVLCVDSLALHLAATTQTPTFSFFGPSSPSKYMPSGQSHGFYHQACPANILFEKRCPYLRTCLTGACLKRANCDTMFRAVYEWYKRVNESAVTK